MLVQTVIFAIGLQKSSVQIYMSKQPFMITAETDLRCFLLPLIIFDLFLQLDSSPPVLSSLDLIWKDTHLCVWDSTADRAWQSNHLYISERIVSRLRSVEGNGTFLQLWSSWRAQLCPSFFYGKKFEPQSQRGDPEPNGHPDRTPEALCGDGSTCQMVIHLSSAPPIRPHL